MSLFDGTPTPGFMSTPETLLNFMKEGQSQGEAISRGFAQGFGLVEPQALDEQRKKKREAKVQGAADLIKQEFGQSGQGKSVDYGGEMGSAQSRPVSGTGNTATGSNTVVGGNSTGSTDPYAPSPKPDVRRETLDYRSSDPALPPPQTLEWYPGASPLPPEPLQNKQAQQTQSSPGIVSQAFQDSQMDKYLEFKYKHAGLWLDEDTGPMMHAWESGLLNYEKIRGQSIQNKIALEEGKKKADLVVQDNKSFLDRVGKIDPAKRARIQGMKRNPETGGPSADQWDALAQAESEQVPKPLSREGKAEADAQAAEARGDHEAAKRIREGAGTKTVMPQEMTFGGVQYLLNPKTGHLTRVTAAGREAQISVAELLRQYTAERRMASNPAAEPADRQKALDQIKFIQEYVQDKFPNQSRLFGGVTPKPSSPTNQPAQKMTKEMFDKLPSGAEYIGNDGKKYRKP